MKLDKHLIAAAAGVLVSMVSLGAWAQEKTVIGAEKAGNKENTIPAWVGNEPAAPGWTFGKNRMDYWKHKDEKPLAVIDASNVEKYADKLTPGQINLVRTIKDYTMPIYPSHRTCGYSDFILQNTKANVGKAKIAADGWSLEAASLPGVPFPEPKSGIEAVWNFLVRYQGVAADMASGTTYVSPAPGSDQGLAVGWSQLFYYPWSAKGTFTPSSDGGIQMGVYYGYTKPAALAGQAVVQRFFFNKETESFFYFTGQRRVRRLPSYAYDAPQIGYENQYPADMPFIFVGNPDRFDWKIVGKKEVYVPYNNFKHSDVSATLAEAMKPKFVSADFRRYELHRVWEIEGTVKEGVRHSAPKKTLYLDEDTWAALVGDDYDAQGKLWRSKEAGARPTWEINACTALVQANFYDFNSGRYVSDPVLHGGKDINSMAESTDKRLQPNYFTAETLRANSER